MSDDGGIVVAGQAAKADDSWQYATVKYRYRDFVIPADSDSVSTSLRWIANHDQLINTDGDPVERVRYYSNQCYPNIYMMDDSLSYVFFQGVDTTDDDTLHRIDMTFVGSSGEKRLLPLDKAEYWNNYYLGHIPDGRPFVPLYTRAIMQDVWPNIDVVYSSNQRGLKYYLVVNSGGEYGAINLKYHGAESLYVDGNDALVIESSIGELVQPQAIAYEMDAYGELSVLGWQPEYDVSGDEVTFMGIGAFSGRLVLEVNWGYVGGLSVQAPKWWSSYFTGRNSGGHDFIYDIDIDIDDYLYFSGFSSNADFPIIGSGISQVVISSDYDVVVGQFDAVHEIQWSTFFGGDGTDRAYGIASDLSSQTIFVCGETNSSPTTLVKFQYGSGFLDDLYQGYVAGFNRLTGERNWATGFGGEGTIAKKIDVDHAGNIFVAGNSGNQLNLVTCNPPTGFFPICTPLSQYGQYLLGTEGGTSTLFQDGFIAKFDQDRVLKWSTFFGGQWVEDVHGIAIDENEGDVYLVGQTKSTANNFSDVFTVMDDNGYFQDWINSNDTPGNSDGFVARFSLSGFLEWSTFFGGEEHDVITGASVGKTWNNESFLVVCGHTESSTYATKNTTPGVNNQGFPHFGSGNMFDESYGGGDHDPFVAMFDDKSNCVWSTYLGGNGDEGIHFRTPMVSISEGRSVYVAGTTYCGSNSSTPLAGFSAGGLSIRHQATHGDVSAASPSTDVYLYVFDENADFHFGTYYGGQGGSPSGSPTRGDILGGIIADDDHIYLTGGTFSTNSLPRRKPYSQSYDLTPTWPSSQQNLRGFFAQLQTNTFALDVENATHPFERLNIYPNPTNGGFWAEIEVNQSEKMDIVIIDLYGRMILSQKATIHPGKQSVFFDLESLPSGVYFLNMNSERRQYVQRVVKI